MYGEKENHNKERENNKKLLQSSCGNYFKKKKATASVNEYSSESGKCTHEKKLRTGF